MFTVSVSSVLLADVDPEALFSTALKVMTEDHMASQNRGAWQKKKKSLNTE